jgi:hypothetical protein
MLVEKIEKILSAKSNPCVTISLNTHRTHPENELDKIEIKNLCKEAENRLLQEFEKRSILQLLQNLESIQNEIDVNYNLESLHIFVSNEVKEYERTIWNCSENKVQISDSFAIKPLIKALNRTEEYMILILSQGGVNLYRAINDSITEEIRNNDFPIKESMHYITDQAKSSDAKQGDDMVREFLNKVDKALCRTNQETKLGCIIVSTEDIYSKYMQVADKPNIILGYTPINYNNVSTHKISVDAWNIIQGIQKKNCEKSIEEMQEAVSKGKVITDLQEIFRATKEGRGELLIASQSFNQAVKMTSQNSFELINNVTELGAIDDITSEIAWEVLSKKGKVVFSEQDDIKPFGKIALKVRY